ncbi:hypothetical protein [Actinomadura sp. DC4]|uniref:hypothetical protein n=1 Tax=Actinomadura sp. DC4 TaxID=3055069 RepID=UPI0025B03C47|nr:hypothetical protein [Actinomadura sp. DC4]MDN3356395.1 hypothetical protein [Actinomadura sp. DC4]
METLARDAVKYLAHKPTFGADRTSTDALYELVSVRLGPDPALAVMVRQAQAGGVTERTLRRLADSIAEAAESDARFADRLERLVRELRRDEPTAATASGERSAAVGGDNSGIISTGDNATNTQTPGVQFRPR